MTARAIKVSFKGTIQSRSESKNLLLNSGDFVTVKRVTLRLLILRCPCGCGDDLLINLDKRSGPAWRLYSKSGLYSLFPSYWRDTQCGSHFIIWNCRIYWCYNRNDEPDEDWRIGERIEQIVLEALKEDDFVHYIDLADELGLIPWESLQACKQLLEKGLCISGEDELKGCFKKSN